MRASAAARRLLVAFLLGAVVGGAATVPFYGRRVEALLLANGRMVQHLQEYRSRVEKLEEARERPRARVVQKVGLEILWDDEAVRLALSERLAPLAGELVGRDLERVDPYLVYALFDGRLVEINGHRYRVTVRAAVVAEEVTVVLMVERLASAARARVPHGPYREAVGEAVLEGLDERQPRLFHDPS